MILLTRKRLTVPRGLEVSAHRSRIRTKHESLGKVSSSFPASWRNSAGSTSFLFTVIRRTLSIAYSFTIILRLWSFSMCQLVHLVLICWIWSGMSGELVGLICFASTFYRDSMEIKGCWETQNLVNTKVDFLLFLRDVSWWLSLPQIHWLIRFLLNYSPLLIDC